MTDKPITPETVRAALEAATPGPWAVEYKHGTTRLIAGGDCTMCDETYYPWVPDNDGDWHLIAMAPDLATAYLAQAEEIERLRKRVAAGENLYRATNFLADNDPDDVVCDGGGTAILVGLSGIRSALAAYRATKERT